MKISGTQAAARLRSRLWRSIITTNLLGMPVLVIYVWMILGVAARNLGNDLKLDPIFIPFNFGLLSLFLVTFVLIHYFHVIRFARPAQEFLEREDQRGADPHKLAVAALETSGRMPYRIMNWSITYYFIGGTLAVLSIQFLYSFSFSQTFIMWLGIVATGTLISIFMFYTSRQVFDNFETRVLDRFPDLLLNGKKAGEGFQLSLRGKFMSSTIMLAGVLVTLTSAVTYNLAVQGLQRQLTEFYAQNLEQDAPNIDSAIESGVGPADLQSYVRSLHPVAIDRVLLVNSAQENLLEEPIRPAERELIHIILSGASGLTAGRPSVHALSPDAFSAVVDRRMNAVVHLPLKNAHLFVLAPEAHYSNVVSGMTVMLLAVTFLAILLSVVYASFSATDIRNPMASLMATIGAIAQGDLTRNVTVTGSDEIGVFAHSLARALETLRRLIGRIGETAGALEAAASAISLKAGEVATGSQSQVGAVTEASGAADRMQASAQGITDSIQTLATSAQESSASIIEVQATIENIAGNVDGLSSAVTQTSSSIHEMNTSIKQVADSVQHLAQRSSEATSALQEMDRLIDRVAANSRESGAISAEVTHDAEAGARAVRLTITGIDRIRNSSSGVAEVITRLGKRAREIGNILTIIEDVTEETNLLALNAAIIAAQAGEHGRGFSVVADEIKDLADRTAASTAEIADLIRTVQEDAARAVTEVRSGSDVIAEGVKLSEEGGLALDKIQESVRRALEQTQSIAAAAVAQADKSRQVLEFIDGLNTLISQIARSTQEQAKSGDQIVSASVRMEDIARHVRRATQEQANGSRHITQAIEHIAEIARYINDAQVEQLKNNERMRGSVRHIFEAAGGNQGRVDNMRQTVEDLKLQADGLRALLAEFRL